MKLEHCLSPCTKIKSKWIKDLFKCKNVKLPTRKQAEHSDINHGDYFLEPSSEGNKSKNKQMGSN